MSRRACLLLLLSTLLAAGAQAQTGIRLPKEKRGKPAAAAKEKPAEKPSEKPNPGVEEVQEIYRCLAPSLPQDWRRAWAVVTELDRGDKTRSFEGRFFYALDGNVEKPLELIACKPEEVARRVYALNAYMEYDKRNWKAATLIFNSDGNFELRYDYE